MQKLKKSLLPLFLAIAMLVMAVSASAAGSTVTTKLGEVKLTLPTAGYYLYKGKERKPAVTVTDVNGKVVDPTYYTVEYKNNINNGTATVTVTGKAPYTDSVTATFTIKKRPLKVSDRRQARLKKMRKGKVYNIYASYILRDKKVPLKNNEMKIEILKGDKVVKITSAGKIKALKKGSAKIRLTVKNNGNILSKVITVKVK